MRQSMDQDTLAALVETAAAREFRALREGELWRLEVRLGAKWFPFAHGANWCASGAR